MHDAYWKEYFVVMMKKRRSWRLRRFEHHRLGIGPARAIYDSF
ncbi:hypothetical protein C7445_1395 [Alicyclobacillus sacchari]|uniref:Uncharacterized protein n=1 Tax=Alicyclobacillus sacchari TaxID=392010 RepID=A0A4R8L7V7_9BACL|nr:hypothetical protein C7445_1395 [Alicyclobacillus sacchari]